MIPRSRAAAWLLGLWAAAALAGCWGRGAREDLSARELFKLAQRAVEKYRYEEAQELIDRIRDEFPFSPFAAEAELLEADMAYKKGAYEEAAAAYRSFEELHPTHPKVPYAMYRRGLAYLELSRPPDRDQTPTRQALEAFQKLLHAYPDSEYAGEARRHVRELRRRLAEHEMYVARYYVRKKKYRAALGRLQTLVTEYPDSPLRDEALRMALELQGRLGEGGGP